MYFCKFKNLYKFTICEVVYKVILSEHQKCKGKQCNNLTIDMRQVPNALEFAGYSFEKELLSEIFGSKSEKGRTVKKLRNDITHEMKEKDIKELVEREEELFGYMDEFLAKIRSGNDIAA